MRTREAIAEPSDCTTYAGWDKGQLPISDDWNEPDENTALATKLARWDSWVIPVLLQQELLSGITFSPDSEQMTWNVDNKAYLTLHRPTKDIVRSQVQAVLDLAALRADRKPEILVQQSSFWPFYRTVAGITPEKFPATFILLRAAVDFSISIHMRFKHAFACLRPDQMSTQVQPMIGTPGHGALPMGHMAEAVTASLVLSQLMTFTDQDEGLRKLKEQLWRLALRIGENRLIAGVHFPVDWVAGGAVGLYVADYFCKAGGLNGWATEVGELKDYSINAQTYLNSVDGLRTAVKTNTSLGTITTSPILRLLVAQSALELQGFDTQKPMPRANVLG